MSNGTPEQHSLDQKAGLSLDEQAYVKERGIEGVYEDIYKDSKRDEHILLNIVMNNFHMQNINKINTTFLQGIGLTVKKIEDVFPREKDGKDSIYERYQKYNVSSLDNTSKLRMSDKGIALVQALAESCVANLPDHSESKTTLEKIAYKSKKDIDGYMGPNTTLLLEKIAQADLNNGTPILSFDGTITPELILKMYSSCHPEQITKIISPSKERSEKITPAQKTKQGESLLKDIEIGEKELLQPGDNVATLTNLNSMYIQYLEISTLEQIQTKREELETTKSQLELQLSSDPTNGILKSRIAHIDSVLTLFIEKEQKLQAIENQKNVDKEKETMEKIGGYTLEVSENNVIIPQYIFDSTSLRKLPSGEEDGAVYAMGFFDTNRPFKQTIFEVRFDDAGNAIPAVHNGQDINGKSDFRFNVKQSSGTIHVDRSPSSVQQVETNTKNTFENLLNNQDIILSHQNFEERHDNVIMRAMEDQFTGQEDELEKNNRKPFLTAFAEENRNFSISSDDRILLPKKMREGDKESFARSLADYFSEHKKAYPNSDYILYKLDAVWDNRNGGYDLPYQENLFGGLDYTKYPSVIDYFTQARAKDLGLTAEQKELIKTPANVFAFYNAHTQRYNVYDSDYQHISDEESKLREQFKSSFRRK